MTQDVPKHEMSESEKKAFVVRQWQIRQGYKGKSVETVRNWIAVIVMLACLGLLTAFYCGLIGG